MIDDLTIAANAAFESSALARRSGSGAAGSRLSSDFGDLLHGSASMSEAEPAAAAPETADDPDGYRDRGSRTDGDPVRHGGREDNRPDTGGDDPADVPESKRASGGRDETDAGVSETEAETTGVVPIADNGKVPADRTSGPRNGSAATQTSGTRVAIPTDAQDSAMRTVPTIPPDESQLKAARANPQHPPGPNSAPGARTAAPAETTAATQRQAGGLAKAIGNGGKAQVSVNVVKEAETLVSQPSFTLVSAAATVRTGGPPNQRSSGKGGSTDAGVNSLLHPTIARVQPQMASTQRTSASLPGQTGAAAQTAPAGGILSNAAGTPMASAETVDGDTPGFASAANSLRGTGPAAAQANGAGKLAPDYRSVADQISVNINKAVKAGSDRIEIRLRPDSLGRVEVRLEVSRDGRVVAAVTVDNRDTLELLKSDARGLERALQDAGLKADSGSLSFSLRGHDDAARHGGGSDQNVPAAGNDDGGAEDGDEPSASAGASYPQGGVTPDGRIDIRA